MATWYASDPRSGQVWSDNTPQISAAGGQLNCAIGVFEFATNLPAADTIRFCKLPKNAIVVAGYLTGDDLDTGTAELDIDIGWEANGVDAVDTDGFGNMGVLTGDTVAEVIPVASIFRGLQGVLNSEGYKKFNAETWVTGLINVDSAATGTGTLSVKIFYIVP